jgi:hypothetical protein
MLQAFPNLYDVKISSLRQNLMALFCYVYELDMVLYYQQNRNIISFVVA